MKKLTDSGKVNQPSTEIQKQIESHYDSLELVAKYIDALILSNRSMAASKIIDSIEVNCGKDVYTYQPDRASKVADQVTEGQLQKTVEELFERRLLKHGHGGFDLNPTQMNKVMQEFNQLEQKCNVSENPEDKEYLTRAENKLNDKGIKLPPRVPPKKSKQKKGSQTATEVVKKLQASAASERKGSTTHEGESISYHSSSRGP